jgi:hypothetical protein
MAICYQIGGIRYQRGCQHRPERPVLLAVDQQLGEGAGLGFPQ